MAAFGVVLRKTHSSLWSADGSHGDSSKEHSNDTANVFLRPGSSESQSTFAPSTLAEQQLRPFRKFASGNSQCKALRLAEFPVEAAMPPATEDALSTSLSLLSESYAESQVEAAMPPATEDALSTSPSLLSEPYAESQVEAAMPPATEDALSRPHNCLEDVVVLVASSGNEFTAAATRESPSGVPASAADVLAAEVCELLCEPSYDDAVVEAAQLLGETFTTPNADEVALLLGNSIDDSAADSSSSNDGSNGAIASEVLLLEGSSSLSSELAGGDLGARTATSAVRLADREELDELSAQLAGWELHRRAALTTHEVGQPACRPQRLRPGPSATAPPSHTCLTVLSAFNPWLPMAGEACHRADARLGPSDAPHSPPWRQPRHPLRTLL